MALTTVLKNIFLEKGTEIDFLKAEQSIKDEANYYEELPVEAYFKAFNAISVPFLAVGYRRFLENGIYLVGFLYDNPDFEVTLETHQVHTSNPESNAPIMKMCIRGTECGLESGKINDKKYILPQNSWGMLTTYDNAVHINAENMFVKEQLSNLSKYFVLNQK